MFNKKQCDEFIKLPKVTCNREVFIGKIYFFLAVVDGLGFKPLATIYY